MTLRGLSGEWITITNTYVCGYETGFIVDCDHVHFIDCYVGGSNKYSWLFGADGVTYLGSILDHCFSYRCGGASIYDNRTLVNERRALTVRNFINEAPQTGGSGWVAGSYVVQTTANPSIIYFQNTASTSEAFYLDYYGEKAGVIGNGGLAFSATNPDTTPPTSTVTNLGRRSDVSAALDNTHLYQITACSRLQLSVTAQLNPTAGANAIVSICYLSAHGDEYGIPIARMFLNASSTVNQQQTISAILPPGTQFFIHVENAVIMGTPLQWLDCTTVFDE